MRMTSSDERARIGIAAERPAGHRTGTAFGTANEVEGPVSHLNSVSRNYKAVLADGFAGAVL